MILFSLRRIKNRNGSAAPLAQFCRRPYEYGRAAQLGFRCGDGSITFKRSIFSTRNIISKDAEFNCLSFHILYPIRIINYSGVNRFLQMPIPYLDDALLEDIFIDLSDFEEE